TCENEARPGGAPEPSCTPQARDPLATHPLDKLTNAASRPEPIRRMADSAHSAPLRTQQSPHTPHESAPPRTLAAATLCLAFAAALPRSTRKSRREPASRGAGSSPMLASNSLAAMHA